MKGINISNVIYVDQRERDREREIIIIVEESLIQNKILSLIDSIISPTN